MRKSITFVFVSLFAACNSQPNGSAIQTSDTNHQQQKKQHVLLISIDGYRHDYTELHQAKNLAKISQRSAMVKQLEPSFPTVTFPNHITLVTGLYPANHGIISNGFYHPELKKSYSMSNSKDAEFYQGVPLWSLAGQQGVKSATYFWPSSEVEQAGHRPDYWQAYNGKIPNQERVDQVIDWFSLPEKERPQFATLYFSEVDSAGHEHGPTAPETFQAVQNIDAVIGNLMERLEALPIDINVIITADHGMQDTREHDRIYTDYILNDYPDLAKCLEFHGGGAYTRIFSTCETKQADLKQLGNIVKNIEGLQYYQHDDIPAQLNYQHHAAIGDAIFMVSDKYLTSNEQSFGPAGMHGYDTEQVSDMNTLLYATGPAFKTGTKVQQAKNIHLYPLIAHILGLKISEPIDGELKVLAPMLAPALSPNSPPNSTLIVAP